MCGIVGIVSSRDYICADLLKSLSNLEYRGYDSVGFSYLDASNQIITIKASGKISNFIQGLNFNNYKSSTAIAHTRWATHGQASDVNSHPHSNELASVVHNGIIENYLELKRQFTPEFNFKTQTDTETILALVCNQINQNNNISLPELGKSLFTNLKGAFATAIITKNYPDAILLAKNKSPLVIGLGDGENYAASDVYAISELTDRFVFLQDGQFAILKHNQFEIFDKSGTKITNPKVETISIAKSANTKNGYDTYMLKEINEQPSVIAANLAKHITPDFDINFENLTFDLSGIKRISVVACGTSFYAGALFKYYCERLAKLPVSCEIASEFRYRDVVFEEDTLYIFLSQSGETADTLAALDFVNQNKAKGSKTLGIVNVVLSSIAKACDGFIECLSGTEIGVASTKNFTTQAICCLLLAYKLALQKGIKADAAILTSLGSLSGRFYTFLNNKSNLEFLQEQSKALAKSPKVMFVARSLLYPVALEGALKLKELAYIPTEGIAAGELKHGPIALVDEDLISICLLSKLVLKDKSESSVQEILARKGNYICISDYQPSQQGGIEQAKTLNISQIADGLHELVLPLVFIPAVQLLSYYTASTLGLDVDKPRNLAKSVTVE